MVNRLSMSTPPSARQFLRQEELKNNSNNNSGGAGGTTFLSVPVVRIQDVILTQSVALA